MLTADRLNKGAGLSGPVIYSLSYHSLLKNKYFYPFSIQFLESEFSNPYFYCNLAFFEQKLKIGVN